MQAVSREHVSHVAMITPRTPLGRPSRVQRYSSIMHRAMEEDSLMTRYDSELFPVFCTGEFNVKNVSNTECFIMTYKHRYT